MNTVLEIKGLTKHYGRIQAVNELYLEIPKGSVYGILGPNGSGKTTTLGMVLGVVRPSSGHFSWFGKGLDFTTKQRLGAILETPNFYPYLSGLRNLQLVAKIKEIEKPDIDEVLKLVNLRGRANSPFKTYSLGMKQRLAIAAALLSDPEVLVLDEPTNGLDPQGIAEIRALITRIAQRGITVIVASHLLDEVERICTDVAVLRQGELLFAGKVEELTGHDGMIEIRSADLGALENALREHPAVQSVKEEETRLLVMLGQQIDPAEINKYLSEKGIFADHLVLRRTSLEKQFLDLIKR